MYASLSRFFLVPGSRSTFPDADPDPAKWYGSETLIKNDFFNRVFIFKSHFSWKTVYIRITFVKRICWHYFLVFLYNWRSLVKPPCYQVLFGPYAVPDEWGKQDAELIILVPRGRGKHKHIRGAVKKRNLHSTKGGGKCLFGLLP